MSGIDVIIVLSASIIFIIIGLLLTIMILAIKKALVSTKPCKIEINENEELSKEVEGGQTLLSALLSQGISVPSPCGGKATCKQCKVQVKAGGGEALETEKGTFSPKMLKQGWRLSCQCKVKSDLKIALPENLLTLKEFSGEVVSNQNVATFIKEMVIELPESLSYIPGDYLQFHVQPFTTSTEHWKETMDEKYYEDWEKFDLFGREIDYSNLSEEVIRAYSMASYPKEGRKLIFNVRIATPLPQKDVIPKNIPWGICSSYLFSLKKGDTIKLSGPFGESHMIEDERPVVFLIGGAGSSFGRSHILDLFYDKKTKRQVDLWYGARSLKENIYQEEYEKLSQEYENFSYNLVLSKPTKEDLEGGWPEKDSKKTGFLFRAFEEGQLKEMEEPENVLYYVCGPPMHNQSVMKLLDDYGVEKESIILDDFGS